MLHLYTRLFRIHHSSTAVTSLHFSTITSITPYKFPLIMHTAPAHCREMSVQRVTKCAPFGKKRSLLLDSPLSGPLFPLLEGVPAFASDTKARPAILRQRR